MSETVHPAPTVTNGADHSLKPLIPGINVGGKKSADGPRAHIEFDCLAATSPHGAVISATIVVPTGSRATLACLVHKL